jgi:hypothetical protein
VYSSYLGGSGNDLGHGIAVDIVGIAYVVGESSSAEVNGDAFVTTVNAILPPEQTRTPGGCSCEDHPIPPQVYTLRPVNTRTGNYWTSITDLAVQSPGPAIVWTRTYASQAITDTTGVLSFGWQHPYYGQPYYAHDAGRGVGAGHCPHLRK